MALFTDSYIAGSWRPGAGRLPVHDPATGQVLAEVATAGVDDCLAAVDAAAEAGPAWAATPPRERAEVLRAAYEAMAAEREEIAALITAENGKVLAEGRSEVGYACEFFRWFAEEAVRVGGELRRAPAGDKNILVRHQPIGVALLVTPWNFPAAMATRKIAPALAAGCSVVLKPAPETPLTALYLADLLSRVGVPPGVVNVVLPDPPSEAVAAMLRHPALRKLSFTGSTVVGALLLAQAAETVVTPSMELGGNAPFLVLPDAEPDRAVAAALQAKLRNGGASCIAANRFYVHESLADAFIDGLARAVGTLVVGPGADPASQLGPLVSAREADKVTALVAEAVAEGAEVVARADIPTGTGGSYAAPTVLAGVGPDASILGQEVFGPVAPVTTYSDVDEVVARANDTPHGLAAYVCGSLDSCLPVADRLDAGIVAVNRGLVSDPAAPFGGFKRSGLGREGGFEGIEAFLEAKYIGVEW